MYLETKCAFALVLLVAHLLSPLSRPLDLIYRLTMLFNIVSSIAIFALPMSLVSALSEEEIRQSLSEAVEYCSSTAEDAVCYNGTFAPGACVPLEDPERTGIKGSTFFVGFASWHSAR